MDKITESLKIVKQLFEKDLGELEDLLKMTDNKKIREVILMVIDSKISTLKNKNEKNNNQMR